MISLQKIRNYSTEPEVFFQNFHISQIFHRPLLPTSKSHVCTWCNVPSSACNGGHCNCWVWNLKRKAPYPSPCNSLIDVAVKDWWKLQSVCNFDGYVEPCRPVNLLNMLCLCVDSLTSLWRKEFHLQKPFSQALFIELDSDIKMQSSFRCLADFPILEVFRLKSSQICKRYIAHISCSES